MSTLPKFKAQPLDVLIKEEFFNEETGELIKFEATFTNHRIISIADNKVCYTQCGKHNWYNPANIDEDITDLLKPGFTYDFLAVKENAQLRNGTMGKGTIIWIAAKERETGKILSHIPLGGQLNPKPKETKTNNVLQF